MGITDWASKDGAFKRQVSSFRDHIEPEGKFPAEKDRYHLYVSYACPWAHRALIVRKLKGLEDFFGECDGVASRIPIPSPYAGLQPGGVNEWGTSDKLGNRRHS